MHISKYLYAIQWPAGLPTLDCEALFRYDTRPMTVKLLMKGPAIRGSLIMAM